MEGMESTDGTELGWETGINPAPLVAGEAESIDASERRLSIVPAGNKFWANPPGPRMPEPEIEAILIDEPAHSEVLAVPVTEPEIEAILVEDPSIDDLLTVVGRIEEARERMPRAGPAGGGPCPSAFGCNFSLGPVADIDPAEDEPESEPEILGDVAVQSRPEDVRIRVDSGQPETVDQDDDDVTIIVSVATVAALAWLVFRRSRAHRR